MHASPRCRQTRSGRTAGHRFHGDPGGITREQPTAGPGCSRVARSGQRVRHQRIRRTTARSGIRAGNRRPQCETTGMRTVVTSGTPPETAEAGDVHAIPLDIPRLVRLRPPQWGRPAVRGGYLASLYVARTSAEIRPRSLTSYPFSFAQARMSAESDADRPRPRAPPAAPPRRPETRRADPT